MSAFTKYRAKQLIEGHRLDDHPSTPIRLARTNRGKQPKGTAPRPSLGEFRTALLRKLGAWS